MLYRLVGHADRAGRGCRSRPGTSRPPSSSGAYGCSNFLTKSAGLWPPYMLSPSMMTRSNGNAAWVFAICCRDLDAAARSPVPLSPIAANFSESGLVGERRLCEAPPDAAAATKSSEVRRRRRGRGHRRTTQTIHAVASGARYWGFSKGGSNEAAAGGFAAAEESLLGARLKVSKSIPDRPPKDKYRDF